MAAVVMRTSTRIVSFESPPTSPVISLTPLTRLAYGSEPVPWQIEHTVTFSPLHTTHGCALFFASLRLPNKTGG